VPRVACKKYDEERAIGVDAGCCGDSESAHLLGSAVSVHYEHDGPS
jgi:hypothetical protein